VSKFDSIDFSSLNQTQAQARYEGELRWAFSKSEIEPHIAKAANDDSALSLLPNHEFLLRSGAKTQLAVKCRKTAHSWGFSLYALAQAAVIERSTISIGSYDEEEAKNKLRYLDWIYGVLPGGERRRLGMSDGSEARRFRNGSIINFLTRKAPTGAGGHFLGDEFSIEPKGKVTAAEILTAALGATTHTGCVRLGGTQRGEDTMFYKIASGAWEAMMEQDEMFANLPRSPWEIGEFPWWGSPALCIDAATALLQAPVLNTYDRVTKFGNARLKEQFVIYLTTPDLGLEMFQREFEMRVLAQGENYFDLETIQANCADEHSDYLFEHCEVVGTNYDHAPETLDDAKDVILRLAGATRRGALRGDFGLAFDVGRFTDHDELMIGHNLPESHETLALRANIGMDDMPFDGKKELLSFAMTHLPIMRGAIDATRGGMGTDLAEWAEKRWPSRLQGIQFTTKNKQLFSSCTKARLQSRKALLPYMPPPSMPTKTGYRDLQKQMLQIKKKVSSAGLVTFDVERNKGHHGDKYWAYALLNHIFGEVESYQPGTVIIVPRGANPRGAEYSRGPAIPNLPRRRVIV
jgi:phage FluMu gp28-like protein